MNKQNLTDEEWNTLDANILSGSVHAWDDPLHAVALFGSGHAEQPQQIEDPSLGLGLGLQGEQGRRFSIGSCPGLFDLPNPIQPEIDLVSPWSLCHSAYNPQVIGGIPMPDLISFSTSTALPYQPEHDPLSSKPVTSSFSNGFNFTFAGLEPMGTENYSQNNHYTTSFQDWDNFAVTIQANPIVQPVMSPQQPESIKHQSPHTTVSRKKGLVSKRKRLSPENRKRTAFTRDIRGCLQCRQSRKRVGGNEWRTSSTKTYQNC